MKEVEVVVGLDIGTSNVRAVVGELLPSGQLDIRGVAEVPCFGMSKGLVMNSPETTRAINTALIEVARQSGCDNILSVNVNVSGTLLRQVVKKGTATRSSEGKTIRIEDVRRLISDVEKGLQHPGFEVLHATPQEYRISDRATNIADPVGNIGVNLETDVHIILNSEEEFMHLQASINETTFKNIEIEHRVFSPVAAALACLSEDETEEGVALVDIGGGVTEIAIYHNKILRHTAVIPCGGDNITKDIQQGCGIRPQYAKLVKEQFGMAFQSEVNDNELVVVPGLGNRPGKEVSLKNVAIIMEARLKEIAAMAMAEIVKSGYERKLVSGIVITGASAEIFLLPNLFKLVTNIDTRIGYPTENLGTIPNSIVKSSAFATAMGLVWRGYKEIDYRATKYQHQIPNIEPKKEINLKTQPQTPPIKEEKAVGNRESFWKRFINNMNDFDDTKGKDDI